MTLTWHGGESDGNGFCCQRLSTMPRDSVQLFGAHPMVGDIGDDDPNWLLFLGWGDTCWNMLKPKLPYDFNIILYSTIMYNTYLTCSIHIHTYIFIVCISVNGIEIFCIYICRRKRARHLCTRLHGGGGEWHWAAEPAMGPPKNPAMGRPLLVDVWLMIV